MPNPLPVNTKDFWKKRLQQAYERGHLHYSIYLCPPPMWENIYHEHKKILEKEVEKGAKVLDAGCGYGRMASLFEHYTGVDLSPDLLNIAREKNPDKEFIEANLEELPFRDKHFDVAFTVSIRAMVIGNLGEEAWLKIEKELKRVAKKLIILEYEEPHIYTVL